MRVCQQTVSFDGSTGHGLFCFYRSVDFIESQNLRDPHRWRDRDISRDQSGEDPRQDESRVKHDSNEETGRVIRCFTGCRDGGVQKTIPLAAYHLHVQSARNTEIKVTLLARFMVSARGGREGGYTCITYSFCMAQLADVPSGRREWYFLAYPRSAI